MQDFAKMLNTEPQLMVAMLASGGAAMLFVYIGIELFQTGWSSYDERYISGAESTMESMFLTIPVQNLIYLSALCFLFVTLLVSYVSGNIIAGVLFGLCAFALPKILVVVMKFNRDKMFNLQLIDALSSISNSLRAGLTLNQAFELVQSEMDKPISQEFLLLNQQLRLGLPLEEALTDMLARMPGQDLELVVTATNIALDIGGNLPEVFSNIADTIRQRHTIEGKVRALTAQGKMQAMVICSLPFFIAIALNFIVPDLMRPMFETWYGLGLIALIIVMEAIGAFIISKIVNIDV